MFSMREPVASGVFYNSDRNILERDMESYFKGLKGKKGATAVIAPHDKLHLCGSVCANSFSRVSESNYIILGSNHSDTGSKFAAMREGLWKTPLGEVTVNSKIAQKIIDRSRHVEYDVMPHENEHSIEVQLPFLQFRFGSNFNIVPILIRNNFDDKIFFNQCKELGKTIAKSIKSERKNWTIVATTDLSSGSKKKVEVKDEEIIDSIKNLSENKFFKTIHENKSHICGYGAVLVALSAAKELGSKTSKLLKYSSSMEVLENPRMVNGYASIIIP